MPSPISLLGIPLDLGASVRGAALGPAAFRIADLAGHLVSLGHEVRDLGDIAPETPLADARGRFGNHDDVIAGWMRAIRARASDAFAQGATPIFLGGDHSLSMATVTAAAAQARASGRDLALLWIDAHADYNTPSTSPSGNMHGMSVAFLTGDEELDGFLADAGTPLKPGAVHLLGLRSIDREERQALADDGLNCVDMRMIDEFGVSALLRDMLGKLDPARTHLHVSLDLDVVDPSLAPGVGTPVEGGLTYREAHLIMELLHESGLVRSLDVVELNPYLDDRGRSARLAVDLIGSLFGRTVLARPTTRRESAE
jgi:arginase